jgi:hypothetical protein
MHARAHLSTTRPSAVKKTWPALPPTRMSRRMNQLHSLLLLSKVSL